MKYTSLQKREQMKLIIGEKILEERKRNELIGEFTKINSPMLTFEQL